MKKTVIGIALAAASILGVAAIPANADTFYVSSDGTVHNITNTNMPMLERTVVQSAVVHPINRTRVITQPAVIRQPTIISQPAVFAPQAQPVMVREREHNSLFHLRLFPLLDFGLF